MQLKDNQIWYSSISSRNIPAGEGATFGYLHRQLIEHLRERIHSGEVTERSLARLTGISQPHLHNVLKGKRLLSTQKADRILAHLELDVRSLIDSWK